VWYENIPYWFSYLGIHFSSCFLLFYFFSFFFSFFMFFFLIVGFFIFSFGSGIVV
jgi:hypothetical protein